MNGVHSPERRGPQPLYNRDYAARYDDLYIKPWARKHQVNQRILTRLLDTFASQPAWLDIACGQAWHFAQFAGLARMTGVDLSEAQLSHARAAAPRAGFIQADMRMLPLPDASFDLVTSFWAAYCYLASPYEIGRFLAEVLRVLKPGGTLYLEVLLPGDLESFNRSAFAGEHGFKVEALTDDFQNWRYTDHGGEHTMASPPSSFFLDRIAHRFVSHAEVHDGSFMTHLVACGLQPAAKPASLS